MSHRKLCFATDKARNIRSINMCQVAYLSTSTTHKHACIHVIIVIMCEAIAILTTHSMSAIKPWPSCPLGNKQPPWQLLTKALSLIMTEEKNKRTHQTKELIKEMMTMRQQMLTRIPLHPTLRASSRLHLQPDRRRRTYCHPRGSGTPATHRNLSPQTSASGSHSIRYYAAARKQRITASHHQHSHNIMYSPPPRCTAVQTRTS